jgi:hypothetical protein
MADFNWDDAKSGAVTGGVAGATAGTMVMPGVGTAVGGAAGLIGGGLIGGFGGFGGGLWDTMSGQVDPGARYGAEKGTRAEMVDNSGVLRDWAYTGKGPSAAQDLLARNRSEGQQRALSNAKALSGGNAALAGQMANRQQAQVSADAGLQGATIRAQEQQNAMQAYQAALETRRQQDLERAKAQMEADQKNADNNSDFIGGLLSGAGGAIGGMF